VFPFLFRDAKSILPRGPRRLWDVSPSCFNHFVGVCSSLADTFKNFFLFTDHHPPYGWIKHGTSAERHSPALRAHAPDLFIQTSLDTNSIDRRPNTFFLPRTPLKGGRGGAKGTKAGEGVRSRPIVGVATLNLQMFFSPPPALLFSRSLSLSPRPPPLLSVLLFSLNFLLFQVLPLDGPYPYFMCTHVGRLGMPNLHSITENTRTMHSLPSNREGTRRDPRASRSRQHRRLRTWRRPPPRKKATAQRRGCSTTHYPTCPSAWYDLRAYLCQRML